MRTRDGSQNVGLHENKRWLPECWFACEKEMALKTLVYLRIRGGSQNVGLYQNKRWFPTVGLHANKRWLSKHWFT